MNLISVTLGCLMGSAVPSTCALWDRACALWDRAFSRAPQGVMQMCAAVFILHHMAAHSTNKF